MNRVIHQVRMNVDLSSTSDGSNTGPSSTASEAAQHRLKLTQLRREFLTSSGLCNDSTPSRVLQTRPVPTNLNLSPHETARSITVIKHSNPDTQGFILKVPKQSLSDPQSLSVQLDSIPSEGMAHSVTNAPLGNSDTLCCYSPTKTKAVMTSSIPKCLYASPLEMEHANECEYTTTFTTFTPESKVHADSVHTEPHTLSQYMFDNRSCATLIADWSRVYHEAHRSTTALGSSYSPSTSQSSPPLRHVNSNACLSVGSPGVTMPHHPSRAYLSNVMSRNRELQHQPLRHSYTVSRPIDGIIANDSGSVSSSSRTHSISAFETNEKPARSTERPFSNEHRGNTGSNWQKGQPSREMDDQLDKMRVTLKDFNTHLSQIDSTLGRMQSCGSLSQYLGSISDHDAEADADLAEPDWNPRLTPPPAPNYYQSSHLITEQSSSRSDVGKSFECDTGVVTAHRTNDLGRRTVTPSPSLGASLSTLSSSVWSSLSSSVTPAKEPHFTAPVSDSAGESDTPDVDTHTNQWRAKMASSAPSRERALNSRPAQAIDPANHLTNQLQDNQNREVRHLVFETKPESRANRAPSRFTDSTSSRSSCDSAIPTPQSDDEVRQVTKRFYPIQQHSYATWNKQTTRSERFHDPSPSIGRARKLKHIRKLDANLCYDASRTFSQPILTTNGSSVHRRSESRTAYSITVVNPGNPRQVIHSDKSYSTNGLPAKELISSGSQSPERSYSSPSSVATGPSSPASASGCSTSSSRSGSASAHMVDSSSVDSLIGHLNKLLCTGQEQQARRVIGRLLDTPRSRRKLDSMISELTSRSRVLDGQYYSYQGLHGDSDPGSHGHPMKAKMATDQGFGADNNGSSPTGSLLRLANSLMSSKSQRLGLHKSQRSSLTSLQSYSRPYDSEYGLSTPNLSERTRSRRLSRVMTGTQPSVHSCMGSLTSLGRSTTVSRSRRHIPWCPNDVIEEPLPSMRPQPRPTALGRPKTTVMPPEATLHNLDSRAVEVASAFTGTSFTELVRALINDMTDEVHIIRSLFIWTVTVDVQSYEFDPIAPVDSLIGMLRRIRSGQLSRNQLLHKLCRYAGIHCQFITGYSKGPAYRPGMPIRNNHLFYCAWLAVHVAEGWRFINVDCAIPRQLDPVSSARSDALLSIDTNFQVETCDEFYFLTDPEQHIFHSFPDHKTWQLLRKPISLERFVRLPLLRSAFFNANLALKKNYGDCLTTTNGQVSIKLLMPHFVGISCILQNCADHSMLRGLCLVEVLHTTDVVRIHVAPSQPGTYYLHIYVAPDWRVEDCRQLACSFQILCAEHNYSRLVVMGRIPEVGFLGPTPAARTLGVSMCAERSPSGGRALFVHTSSDPLRIPFAIAPGLKICHQLKSFDRPGHQMVDCDSYALLQMRPPKSNSHGPAVNAYYHIRMPIEGFYYLTIYASSNADSDTDHLECVYRILIDVRKTPACPSSVPAFPRQTFWWVDCRLLEPLSQRLCVNRQYTFRLDAPQYDSVAVVINEADWYFLSPTSPAGRWTGKIQVGEFLGQLSVFGRFSHRPNGFGYSLPGHNHNNDSNKVEEATEEGDAYVKLLDYLLVE